METLADRVKMFNAKIGNSKVFDGTCQNLGTRYEQIVAPPKPIDKEQPCEYCQNMRYIYSAAGKLTSCPKCGVATKWKTAKLESYCSDSERSRKNTFETFQIAANGVTNAKLLECLKAAKSFASNPKGWLVIYGKRGNGKSHLSAAAYNRCKASSNPNAIFISMPDLVDSLKALFDKRTADDQHTTYDERLSVYKEIPVLFLDDLGAEKVSDWSQSVLFSIMDYRYRNELATMITSNLLLTDDDCGVESRVLSRFTHASFCTMIENNSANYRPKAS